MTQLASLALSSMLVAGCATAQVDAALARRAAPTGVSFGPQIAFDQHVVSAIRGPDREPDARDRRWLRFELSGPGGTSAVDCWLRARHGSFGLAAQATLVCNSEGGHMIVTGRGSTDLFSLDRVHGRSEHQDAQRDPRLGRAALAVRGSGLVINLHRGGVNGQPLGPAVAALTLEPPRVWVDPALDPEARARVAMVVGALLALHRAEGGVP